MRALATVLLAALSGPAAADGASFALAVDGACFQNLPALSGSAAVLRGAGWATGPGAGPGETEFWHDTSHVFLAVPGGADGAGCTVMDSAVSKAAAEDYLERLLDTRFPGKWEKAQGYGGQDMWRIAHANATTRIYINDGMDGGAAIALESRR